MLSNRQSVSIEYLRGYFVYIEYGECWISVMQLIQFWTAQFVIPESVGKVNQRLKLIQ